MSKKEFEETQEFWDRVAKDWYIQVGDEGDKNRILNSDPVLWQFAGDVRDLNILDAGCGTGYLSKKLSNSGAHVIGIDFSENMIQIAKEKYPEILFYVDSCSELKKIENNSQDMIVSNYVLMDTPDLNNTMEAFHRVLKVDGVVILIFSHPCFPQGQTTETSNTGLQYKWDSSYFTSRKVIEDPWGHFTSEFIWFHRPLSDYWKAFRSGGFEILDFEEPRISKERYSLVKNEKSLKNSKMRPCSVAFKLRKKQV